MQWPWVTRTSLDNAQKTVDHLRDLNFRVLEQISERDRRIGDLQEKLRVVLGEWDGRWGVVGAIFANLPSDEQAAFINAVGLALKGWPGAMQSDTQMIYIVDALDENGILLLGNLAEFLRMKRGDEQAVSA